MFIRMTGLLLLFFIPMFALAIPSEIIIISHADKLNQDDHSVILMSSCCHASLLE